MKKINTLLALLSALLLLGACEKDGEKFYLSSPVESDLIASTNAVVLTEATAKLRIIPCLERPDIANQRPEISSDQRHSNYRTSIPV